MAQKSRTREITLVENSGTFNTFLKRFTKSKDSEYDFDSLSLLRKLLSNEKARILNVIKTKQPGSIYELAKILKRDFKTVSEDIKLLQRFGFIEMSAEKTGNRKRLKPSVVVDSVIINLKL